ncbi:DUF6338 family protein [Salinisphaera dokdonensis]|uniref:DUF6338 family protein n=1 Tax=Salinisphaera dokdonensis TaxID=454598 RepID=UPI003340EDBF
MNIWTPDSLVLFVAFAIPGFVASKTYEILVPSEGSAKLIDAVAYSCAIYAVVGAPLYLTARSDWSLNHPVWLSLLFAVVLFVLPILGALAWWQLRKAQLFQTFAPHPTSNSWDFIFSQRKSYWVKVHTAGGKIYAGCFSSKSFASSTPAEEQIYLEESWLLDDQNGFDRVKNRSAGVLILKSDISAIEFFDFE